MLLFFSIFAFSSPQSNQITVDKLKTKAENVLIVYFSCTGNTKGVATKINSLIGGDLIEIVPKEPYTSADLNYGNQDSRVVKEHNDPTILPDISGDIANFGQYETIFLGYPLWWGMAPNIIRTFMKKYDFSSKNINTFCTSISTSTDSSKNILTELAPNAKWNDSWKRFRTSPSESDVKEWTDSLDLSPTNPNDKILITYFSATGNTRRVAESIHSLLKFGKIAEIRPVQPYISSDLNYNDQNSRVTREHQDSSLRPAIHDVEGVDGAETIFVGYPLWWREAPHAVYTFIEKYKFNGKTVIPFCTSTSDDMKNSGKNLAAKTSNANWFKGQRFSSSADYDDVKKWVDKIVESSSNNEIKFKDATIGSGLSKAAIIGISVAAAVVAIAIIVIVVIIVVKKKRQNASNAEITN